MRRPNLKWLTKAIILLVGSGLLFLLITNWISSDPPYTNNGYPVNSAQKAKQHEPLQQKPPPIAEPELKNDILPDIQEPPQKQQLAPPGKEKRDWHDFTAMGRDAQRVGIGEQGKRATLDDESQRELERKMSLENGFNALLSDSISVNRSIPDIRYKG